MTKDILTYSSLSFCFFQMVKLLIIFSVIRLEKETGDRVKGFLKDIEQLNQKERKALTNLIKELIFSDEEVKIVVKRHTEKLKES